jgi:signal transduction histidine kinase
MNSQRLSWRIGLPFALFVLAGSVALVLIIGWNLAREDSARFENLARTNAAFINRVKLPPSLRMAQELTQVLGMSKESQLLGTCVSFRRDGVLTPAPMDLVGMRHVYDQPADGKCRWYGGSWEVVIVPLDSGYDLVLFQDSFVFRSGPWIRAILPVLVIFWLLSLGVAWLVSRSFVRPLQHLAAKLPDIERPEEIDLPEVERKDEIGDVARAFVRTRGALQKERAERERAEKLAVLGRMTAALAHEIQNPVAAIKMHAQLWQGDDANGTAQVIEHEASRIESLVNQWMFLSKPQPPAMSQVDVASLLGRAVRTHQAQLDHSQVKVVLRVEAPQLVQGDAKRLTQVFSNLLVNAVQAMPRGGQLTIASETTASGVEVTVSDTGRGFSDVALSRFSEFFFSEKEGGMGIGLSVAREIMKAHGGELRVANGAAGGACVKVTLPSGASARERGLSCPPSSVADGSANSGPPP